MAYVARKPFLYEGVKYVPGDTVKDFDSFPKKERFIMTGFVKQTEDVIEYTRPVRKKSQPKVEVETVVEDFVPGSA